MKSVERAEKKKYRSTGSVYPQTCPNSLDRAPSTHALRCPGMKNNETNVVSDAMGAAESSGAYCCGGTLTADRQEVGTPIEQVLTVSRDRAGSNEDSSVLSSSPSPLSLAAQESLGMDEPSGEGGGGGGKDDRGRAPLPKKVYGRLSKCCPYIGFFHYAPR